MSGQKSASPVDHAAAEIIRHQAVLPQKRDSGLLHQRHQFQSSRHGRMVPELQVHQLYRLLRRPHPTSSCPRRPHMRRSTASKTSTTTYWSTRRSPTTSTARGPRKAVFLMFDEATEELARELELEVCFPSARLRQYRVDKVVTTRIADEAGGESVPNVLAGVDSDESLRRASRDLGPGSGKPYAFRRLGSHHLVDLQRGRLAESRRRDRRGPVV